MERAMAVAMVTTMGTGGSDGNVVMAMGMRMVLILKNKGDITATMQV